MCDTTKVCLLDDVDKNGLPELFGNTFAASEGAEEGAAIADLVRSLLSTTPANDLRVYGARNAGHIIGCAIFTRLAYDRDDRRVYLLSPMAVQTAYQGQGIGQLLLQQALIDLKNCGVNVAVTYGDPAFYSKVGFQPVDTSQVPAPLPLSMPHGWIAQSLDGRDLAALRGAAHCAPALNDPAFW